MTSILKSIEKWATENDERERLLIILVWVGFGLSVLIGTLIAAWIMLPPTYRWF